MIDLGLPTSIDPSGTDAYGYYAYDDTDEGYDLAPEFNYVNISTTGTNLNLNDLGEKTDISQVWSTFCTLPFTFQYYGITYNQVTVCANGWLAFGNQSWNDAFRNFPSAYTLLRQ